MKNYFFFLIPATALLLGACSTYEEVPATSGKNETLVGFQAEIAPREQSRADINVDFETGLSGTWNDEDNLGVLANDFTRLLQFTFNPANKAFEGALSGTNGDWAYRAFYPHNGNATVSGTTVTLPFNAQRTQQGNKYNSEFDIMAADAITCADSEPGKTPDGNAVKFNLHRLTSVLALKLQGGDAAEKVASIMLTASKPIASEQLTFTIPSDPTAAYDPSAINPTLIAEGTSAMGAPISIDSKQMTVTYADGTAPSADYSETFFNVLPDDNYGDLTFSICTDKGNAASFTINRSTPVIANWVYTVDRTVSFAKAAAPTVEWIGHDDPAARYELAESGNSADIRVSVPGGIKSMQVDITSSVLTTPMGEGQPSMLEMVNLAPSMDLTNPANADMATSLASLGFPTPTQLQNQQYVFFQIGDLIDMLAAISPADQTTTADFKFTVTDNAGTATEITLRFVKTIPLPTIVYNEDANLWSNTATLTVSNVPDSATGIKAQYRRKGATEWKDANGSGNGVWTIAATWTESQNSAGKTIHTVDNTTGIFAGNKGYEYQLIYTEGSSLQTIAGDNEIGVSTGDTIPTVSDSKLSCYTSANTDAAFWGSGNNRFAPSLCTFDSTTKGAFMAAIKPIALVNLAPGNLFTGLFKFNGIGAGTGTVSFGQKYNYTARPTALRLRYRAKIGTVTATDSGSFIAKGKQDQASIVVCITDWNDRHQTTAGKGSPAGVWNPETQTGLSADKKIIGYGIVYPSETNAEMTELVIPLSYYDKDTAAPTGNYTIVISCATSRYGDYLNGCDSNELRVSDFEWVY